jgi:hypothetical protein
MKLRKERAIALLVAHGAVALKLADIADNRIGIAPDGRLAPSGLLLAISGFGMWASYRALRWADEQAGDETNFKNNEIAAVTMLAVLILGAGLVAFSYGLFSGGYMRPST